jgi:hypothetical protein
MKLLHLRKWARKIMGSRRSRPARSRPSRAVPQLELLEDRLTPSAVSWIGSGDGTSWTDGRNWSGGATPAPGDDVTINSTFATINHSGTDAVNSLTLLGGTLANSGSLTTNQGLTLSSSFATIANTGALTVGGTFTWTSGTLSGAGNTVLDGASSLSGGFFSMLTDQHVDNHGTATITNGNSIDFRGNAVWNNDAGATFGLQGSGSLATFFAGPAAAFNNFGTLNKTAPGGTASIGVAFNNSGTVDVQAGTLNLGGGGSGSGTFTVEAGAVLTAGNYTLQNATVSGAGVLQVGTFNSLTVAGPSTVANLTVNGGTVTANAAVNVQHLTLSSGTVTANAPLDVQNLTLSGGTLTGPATVTIDTNLTWTGGNLTGTGDTVLDGTSALTGSFFSALGRQVDNFGTATVVAGTSVSFQNNAIWNNKPGSTLILPDSAGLSTFFSSGSQLNNAGTVLKTAPGGTSSIGIAFNNSGSVDVQAGTLSLGGGGTGSSTFTIETGAVLTAGNYTLQNATVAGAGVLQAGTFNTLTVAGASTVQNLTVNGGTVTANAPLNVQNLTLSSGTVTANAALDVQNLTLSGGTLTGPATVTIDTNLTWTGGNLTGTGDTVLNGTSALTGSFFSALGRQVDNFGTATVVAGTSVSFQNNAIWNNKPGSTLILPDSASLSSFFSSGSQLNNAGTMLKTAPGGTSSIAVALNNTGTVDVQAGTLSLGGGGTGGGTFTVEAGAVLTAGNYTLQNATVSGAGVLQVGTFNSLTVAGASTVQNLTVNGGTVTANAALDVQNLTLSGGTLTGPATVTVENTFTWTGGTLSGTGDTVLNGASSLSGGFFSMLGRLVDNNGTATITAGNSIDFTGSGVWNNNVGATFVLQDSSSLGNFFAGPSSAFNNFGTLNKTGPSGTASIGVPFNNSGTVDVQVGTLNLGGGGIGSSTFTVEAGAVLTAGNYTLQNATVAGAGVLQVGTFNSLTVAGASTVQNLTVNGGTVTANAALDVQNLTLSGGTLTGPATVTIDTAFTWMGGTLSGTGDTVLNGASSLSGGFFSMLGRLVDNNATATITNGNSVDFTGNVVWNNNASSTLLLQGSGSLGNFFAGPSAVLNNAGLIQKAAPAGTSGIGIAVNNSGTIEVDAGTLSLAGLTNLSGTTLTGGTYLLSGVLQVPNADIHTNAATIVLDGPSSEFFNSAFFAQNNALTNLDTNAAAGSLTVVDGGNLQTSGAFSNAGTVTVGPGSAFTATGNYTQTGGATVVNGTLAASPTVAVDGGSLSGSGTVNANLINAGQVTPGDAPAILTVNGTYTQTSSGVLVIQIGGTTAGSGYSQLAVSGAAALAGSLDVIDLNNFLPNAGDTFAVLTFASHTGNFDSYSGLNLANGHVLVPEVAAGDTGLNLVTFVTTTTTVASGAANNTSIYGQDVTFTATVLAADGSTPTGPVQFQLNGANVGNPVSLAGGTATFDAGILPANTYQVVAVYLGGGFALGSTSAPLTYTVNPDPTTTTVASSPSITAFGQSVTFTAVVAATPPGSGTPTGTVSFYDGASLLGTVALPPGGPDQVSFTTAALAVGNHTITAVYGGDNNFITSTSTGITEVILGPGVAVFGTSLYVVGANTADFVQINPVGASGTGSTGLQVNSLLNGVWSTRTFSQAFTDIHIFGYGGNDTILLANSLTMDTSVTEGDGNNFIQTAGGNDVISVGRGSNVVFSGNGNKTIAAHDVAGTNVFIRLGTGTDVVTLGDGNDQVVLGAGNNSVTAGNGSDAVLAGNGNNHVTLGNGNDFIQTGSGADAIAVGNGTATILTGNGNKTITAGNGNDFVLAGTGTDVVTLGGGNDTVLVGDGGNTVTLGNGRDFVHAGNGNNNVTVGDGNFDTVQVGDGDNVVVAGNGNYDFLIAGNGDNLIVAGMGQHTVLAGNGSNILIDGSVALTQPGDTLRQVLADWRANGATAANVASIRSRLQVSYNTSHANFLAAGSGLDWFWFTFAQDQTTIKPTDLRN